MLTRLMAISAARSGGANWERMWAGGLAPGEAFDAAQPELALQALIPGSGITGLSPSTQGSLQLHGKRVLVPGCGLSSKPQTIFTDRKAQGRIDVRHEVIRISLRCTSNGKQNIQHLSGDKSKPLRKAVEMLCLAE